MDRFVYFNCTYGSKKDKPMILSRENSLLYDTEEKYHSYKEIKNLNVQGFIYEGEISAKDCKEVAICFYKKNNTLNCKFLKVLAKSKEAMNVEDLYDFEINDNIEIKNIYLGLIDYFYVKNKTTGKKEFELYYIHPYNRVIWYDGMFEDMEFKELSKNYNDLKWRHNLLSVFKESE